MIRRTLEEPLRRHLERGKSVLLLGPRQTGKTTLLGGLGAQLSVSLVAPAARQRYERDPALLAGEVRALTRPPRARPPLVVVDEVQRVPALMDVAQELIDRREAQLVLTGSSARRLRRGQDINLLPGRVVALRLDPLTIDEAPPRTAEDAILFGALPAIRVIRDADDREADLRSYVETYLEEEVRQEAVVRNVAAFGRFLEMAALEAGRIVNYSKISRDVGVSSATLQSYYEILCDCLVAERVEPVVRSATRKKLTKASRYLIFDLGVRRLAAREGTRLHPERMGELFEQLVGLEMIRLCRLHAPQSRLKFWRDPNGPEVDWVIEREGGYIPIEVKLTDRPSEAHTKHLRVFMREYAAPAGFVVCNAPRRVRLGDAITAIPWTDLRSIVEPM
jgi:predicted AAA+ superfamily ATPase